MKRWVLVVLLSTVVGSGYGQELSAEGKALVRRGLECSENGDAQCVMENFERLLAHDEVNAEQADAVKKILASAYFDLAQERVEKDVFDQRMEAYCLRGIELGRDVGRTTDVEALAFHIWVAGYHTHRADRSEANTWIRKITRIQSRLDIEDKAARREAVQWADDAIRGLERYWTDRSSTSVSFSLGALFGQSSAGSRSAEGSKGVTERPSKPGASQRQTWNGAFTTTKKKDFGEYWEYKVVCGATNAAYGVRHFKKSGKVYSMRLLSTKYHSLEEAARNLCNQ